MYDGDLVLDWGGSTSIADFLKATTVGVGIIKSYRVNCQLNITEFLHHDGGYFVSACVYRKVYLLHFIFSQSICTLPCPTVMFTLSLSLSLSLSLDVSLVS